MKKRKSVIAIVAVVALVALLGVCLAACNAKKANEYEKKLEKAGYEVEFYSDEELAEEQENFGYELEWGLYADKIADNIEFVYVVKYKTESGAKYTYDRIKTVDADGIAIGNFALEREGTIIIYGTVQAVKDAK